MLRPYTYKSWIGFERSSINNNLNSLKTILSVNSRSSNNTESFIHKIVKETIKNFLGCRNTTIKVIVHYPANGDRSKLVDEIIFTLIGPITSQNLKHEIAQSHDIIGEDFCFQRENIVACELYELSDYHLYQNLFPYHSTSSLQQQQ